MQFFLVTVSHEHGVAASGIFDRARIVRSVILLQEGRDWKAAENALLDVFAIDPHRTATRMNLSMLRQQMARSEVTKKRSGHKRR